jgi:DNA-directed RNA polymerase sigma subunit (sigma70/sigma32)
MENGAKPATKKDLDELREELRAASKQDLNQLREELRAELASKQDLNQLREELRAELASKQDLNQLREELRAELASKQDLIDMETRILTAFYGYARTNDKTLKQLGSLYGVVNERVEVVERRVLDIEERLNMPPQSDPPPAI